MERLTVSFLGEGKRTATGQWKKQIIYQNCHCFGLVVFYKSKGTLSLCVCVCVLVCYNRHRNHPLRSFPHRRYLWKYVWRNFLLTLTSRWFMQQGELQGFRALIAELVKQTRWHLTNTHKHSESPITHKAADILEKRSTAVDSSIEAEYYPTA